VAAQSPATIEIMPPAWQRQAKENIATAKAHGQMALDEIGLVA
jgi:hypothetical protein